MEKLNNILVILLIIISHQKIFPVESDRNDKNKSLIDNACVTSSTNFSCSHYSSEKITLAVEYETFEVLDSFDLHRKHLHDLTFGNGYLWIIRSNEFEYDTIFKVDPIDGEIINSFEIPVPKSYWSQGLAWDSLSVGGPFLLLTIENPVNKIMKIRLSDYQIVQSYELPAKNPSGLDIKDSLIWINIKGNRNLATFNPLNNNFTQLISLPYLSHSIKFSSFSKDKSLLWVTQSIFWLDSNFIYLININTGKRVKSYKAPGLRVIGLAIDNISDDAPNLWTADFETGKIYKIREPSIINTNNDNNENINVAFHPNPFTDKLYITLSISNDSNVRFDIYDILGRHIKQLVDTYLKANLYEFTFDGSALSSGTYYYVLQSGGKVETGKLILIK